MRSTLIFLKITSILFLLRVNLLQLIIKTQKPNPIKKKKTNWIIISDFSSMI